MSITSGWGRFSAAASAAVAAAAVLPAAAVAAVIVMAAAGLRVIGESARHKGLDRGVRLSGHAAVELNSGAGQRVLRPRADPAADQNLHRHAGQELGQRAVAAAAGVRDAGAGDLPVLNVINLELLCVAEMLKYHAVFIGNRDFHILFLRLMMDGAGGPSEAPPPRAESSRGMYSP